MVELVRIHGASEMEEILKQLPEELAKRALVSSLRDGATVVLDEARRRAPVGAESKGRVRFRYTKRGKVSVSNYGKLKLNLRLANLSARRTPHSATVVVTVGKAYWGMFVEFGTRKMKARPFMRPAFEAKKMEALDRIGRALGENIEKVSVRLAGN